MTITRHYLVDTGVFIHFFRGDRTAIDFFRLQHLPENNGDKDADQTARAVRLLLEIAPIGVPLLAMLELYARRSPTVYSRG